MQRANKNPDADASRELEAILPHAEFLLSTDQLKPEDVGGLLNVVAIHHRTMGRYTAARQAFSTALASAEQSFAPGHPAIALSQSNLALVLNDPGQLKEARDLLRKSHSAFRNDLGLVMHTRKA